MKYEASSQGACGGARVPACKVSKARMPASGRTYKWQTTICAHADLWLVHIDKDSWVSQWSTSSVAGYNTLLGPSHGLLVNEVNGSEWSRLEIICQLASSGRTAIHRYIQQNAAGNVLT